jgi:hypothetical protein
MFCTQYKENLNYCLPSVLGNVESQGGETITMAKVISLIAGKFTPADQAFLSVPKVRSISLGINNHYFILGCNGKRLSHEDAMLMKTICFLKLLT